MQHLDDGQWDEYGCFVFQIISVGGLEIRSQPNSSDEYRAGRYFHMNELVAVDLIQPCRIPNSKDGPFLRLADRSGWLFVHKDGSLVMKQIPVESGLWAFYVDNYPVGQALRRHPIDRSDVSVERNGIVAYAPMQKLYCDRQVVDPATLVRFYRVQGTDGWIFDKRYDSDDKKSCQCMLLEESQVKRGLFAYRALQDLAIRSEPELNDDCRTLRSIFKDEIVVVDIIREDPAKNQSYSKNNGPFLHLADGSGWLFEMKRNELMMEPIPIKEGRWSFRVLNEPNGVHLRRQPIDDAARPRAPKLGFKDSIHYKPNFLVECDRMIQGPKGVNFYRVVGADGWIFDKQSDKEILELVDTANSLKRTEPTGLPEWSIDFVRGVASAIPGVRELEHDEIARVLSFRTKETRVNIYYGTRTIGTAMHHPLKGKAQIFRRSCTPQVLVDILKDPLVHAGKIHPTFSDRDDVKGIIEVQDQVVETPLGNGVLVEIEEELRNNLIDINKEIEDLMIKQVKMLKVLKACDDSEAKTAKTRLCNRDIRRIEEEDALKKIVKIKNDEKKRRQSVEAREKKRQLEARRERDARREREQRLLELTCEECHQEFPDDTILQVHCRDVHDFCCNHCGEVFRSYDALEMHCVALEHY